MPPFDVNWQDLLDLHVVKKLREIVRRRLSVEIGFASADGVLVDGPRDARACVESASKAARAAILRYRCDGHAGRLEVVNPIVVDGTYLGCAFAPKPEGDDDLLEEL